MQAKDMLSQYNITVTQAHNWIMSNTDNPSLIFNTAKQFNLSAAVLAEIVSDSIPSADAGLVESYFTQHGLNPAELTGSASHLQTEGGSMSLDFSVTGSHGNDQLTYQGLDTSAGVIQGLSGDDTLTANSTALFHEFVMLGGQGNDSYHLSDSGSYFIYDAGGQDSVTIAATFNELTAATINGGKDLIVAHLDYSMTLVVADWKNPANRIDSATLEDGSFSFDEYLAAINMYSQGELTGEDGGITGADLNSRIDLFKHIGDLDDSLADTLNVEFTGLVNSDALYNELLA